MLQRDSYICVFGMIEMDRETYVSFSVMSRHVRLNQTGFQGLVVFWRGLGND